MIFMCHSKNLPKRPLTNYLALADKDSDIVVRKVSIYKLLNINIRQGLRYFVPFTALNMKRPLTSYFSLT